jgi:hypothetical protein
MVEDMIEATVPIMTVRRIHQRSLRGAVSPDGVVGESEAGESEAGGIEGGV